MVISCCGNWSIGRQGHVTYYILFYTLNFIKTLLSRKNFKDENSSKGTHGWISMWHPFSLITSVFLMFHEVCLGMWVWGSFRKSFIYAFTTSISITAASKQIGDTWNVSHPSKQREYITVKFLRLMKSDQLTSLAWPCCRHITLLLVEKTHLEKLFTWFIFQCLYNQHFSVASS